MKIIGVGVDIVDNLRIKKSIKNKKFILRIYSKKEINLSKKINDKINYFAKRFAAKESLSKAIGIGFRKGLNFKDISILNDRYGKPYYELNNKVKELICTKLKVKKIKISLSLADEKKYSIAFSVIHK
tara:strand:- start:264 stop:647 length:384 start_codon:yes stop_codon:yes gene_type:complete